MYSIYFKFRLNWANNKVLLSECTHIYIYHETLCHQGVFIERFLEELSEEQREPFENYGKSLIEDIGDSKPLYVHFTQRIDLKDFCCHVRELEQIVPEDSFCFSNENNYPYNVLDEDFLREVIGLK